MQECAVPESGTGSRALDGERQRIFDALRDAGAFGEGNGSLPNWLDFVRRRPDVAEQLLGELKYAQVTTVIRKPGAWMMDKWIRWGRPNK